MYEKRSERPLAAWHFARRMVRHSAAVLAIVVFSLGVGMWGYSHYEGLRWRDSFLNAAMLLGGMGPVNDPKTDGGKVFAGLYALYAGLVFIVSAGFLLAPVAHRLLHRFHWEK
jgi:hypothetical protein